MSLGRESACRSLNGFANCSMPPLKWSRRPASERTFAFCSHVATHNRSSIIGWPRQGFTHPWKRSPADVCPLIGLCAYSFRGMIVLCLSPMDRHQSSSPESDHDPQHAIADLKDALDRSQSDIE